MKKQLEGFDEVITVGNSAGGYMAVLIGCKLNAGRIFCFSGQFDLSDRIENYPMMLQYQKDDSVSKYYDITDLVNKSDVPVFYFYPAYVDQDIWQASRVADCKNVRVLRFRQRLHGQSMYVEDLPSVLSYSNEKLDALFKIYSGKLIFPFVWSIKVSGIKIAVKGLGLYFLKKIYVKLQKIKQLRRST